MAQDVVLDVEEKPSFGQWIGLSMQHMFSMFGSTVLVPILVGLLFSKIERFAKWHKMLFSM